MTRKEYFNRGKTPEGIAQIKLNKEKRYKRLREGYFRDRYNITIDDFIKMEALQNGKCKICKIKSDKTLHVDHDHDTGEVRALLC